MARPQKKDTDKFTHRLYVRFSAADLERCKNMALSKGLSVSDYIRHLVEQDASSKSSRVVEVVNDNAPSSSIDESFLQELYRIGNNLNQLTKKFHQTGEEPQGLRALFPVLESILTHIFKRINVE